MNSSDPSVVEAPVLRARVIEIALALGLMTLGGCVDVNGGAAELNWSLRNHVGDRITCEAASIDEVRLHWRAAASETPEEPRVFDCDAARGATAFEIAEGDTLFWIELRCADGSSPEPGTYHVPPPILRQVIEGEVVTLQTLLVVAYDESSYGAGSAPICPRDKCTCIPPVADRD